MRKAFLFAVLGICIVSLFGCVQITVSPSNDTEKQESESHAANVISRQPQADDSLDNLQFSIVSVVEFNGSPSGVAYIESSRSNTCDATVRIVLDDNGETVYESTRIVPGERLDEITLDKTLPSGVYPAKAVFVAFDPNTGNTAKEDVHSITLVVRN